MAKKSKYHRRADGLLETTRTDKRTGKRIHFYGSTNKDIDDQIMDYRCKQERGRLFSEVADEWKAAHFPTLALNTLRGYRPAYRRAVNEFGDTPINQIKPPQIKRFLTQFARGGMAKKTVGTQKLLLNLIFGYAVEAGDLEYCPTTHVKPPANLKKSYREPASTEDEQRVKASYKSWLLPFLILYTGMRKGEALAIQKEDFDFENNVIHVTKSVYHDGDRPKIKRPKTENGYRDIGLLYPLIDVLNLATLPDGYLFSDDGGKTPLTNRRYETLWRSYKKATGINCTAHQLRHSYASMLFELGVDPKDAQGQLGHATLAMTTDTYTHVREARKKSVVASINEKLRAQEADNA